MQRGRLPGGSGICADVSRTQQELARLKSCEGKWMEPRAVTCGLSRPETRYRERPAPDHPAPAWWDLLPWPCPTMVFPAFENYVKGRVTGTLGLLAHCLDAYDSGGWNSGRVSHVGGRAPTCCLPGASAGSRVGGRAAGTGPQLPGMAAGVPRGALSGCTTCQLPRFALCMPVPGVLLQRCCPSVTPLGRCFPWGQVLGLCHTDFCSMRSGQAQPF